MKSRGNSLVGVLVTAAILILLAIVFTVGSGALTGKEGSSRPDGNGKTLVGKSMYRARDEVCRSNLGQVRQSIQILTDPNDNTPPETLEETKLGEDFYKCPIGKEPYEYDKSTGQVKCVHPGHEKY